MWRLIATATSKTQNFTKTIELPRKLKFFGINVNKNAKEQAEKFKSLKMVKDEGLMMKDEGWRLKDEGWRLKDEGWRLNEEGWRWNDEGWMMKDEGWMMKDLSSWGVLLTDWQTN